ncbi:hypothetical protein SSX86_001225 [Deinandra increscens subsp. villosa]|uniref:Uncharacterized protein n=1 Tax=Deinandra increscens subsp. villosa TaxID=3103831 RepID=A0AAP0DYN1_9ASTR
MREDHHEASSNRKSKSINASSKKLHHQQQKNMNLSSVIAPITEGDAVLSLSEKDSIEKNSPISVAIDADLSTVDIRKTKLNCDQTLDSDNNVALQFQFPEEAARISPISEAFVFYEDQSSIESYIASLNQYILPSFIGSTEVTPLPSKSPAETPPSLTNLETTPSSSSTVAITAENAEIHVTKTEETKSIKLQSLAKHLGESMFQVLHSSDIDPNHKKLLDALVKMVIEEFCSLHEERGLVAERFSNKVKLVLLSYLLVMLLISAGFFLLSNAQSSYHGPTPT